MAMPPLDLTLIQSLLSSKTISNEITNANDLTTPGFYFVEHHALANMPTPNWCHLFVNANTSKNRIVQFCFTDHAESVWFRVKVDDSWSPWKRFVITPKNNMTTIDDPRILSQWYAMLSCQADGTYTNYSIAPTAIMVEQRPSSDLAFYFKFVLPAKPESISDVQPRPLGIGTTGPTLNYCIQVLADQVPGINDGLSMIEPELILDNPSGGNLIYSARSRANGTFTDQDQTMYIAPNTDQLSPAPQVHWGDTVIMTLVSHNVRYNPFPSGSISI